MKKTKLYRRVMHAVAPEFAKARPLNADPQKRFKEPPRFRKEINLPPRCLPRPRATLEELVSDIGLTEEQARKVLARVYPKPSTNPVTLPPEMLELVQRLAAWQAEMKLCDKSFARLIGISAKTWRQRLIQGEILHINLERMMARLRAAVASLPV